MVNIVVSTPTVSVTTLGAQIREVGQSLTLQCQVTTVKGIASGMYIVWNSGGTELVRINVSSTTMGNSLVYTDYYTISQLSTTDDDKVIQCEGVINASPPVMANDSIRLDVTGEYTYVIILYASIVYDLCIFYTQFPLLQSPYHHLVPYKELWWVVIKLSIVK